MLPDNVQQLLHNNFSSLNMELHYGQVVHIFLVILYILLTLPVLYMKHFTLRSYEAF